MWISSTMAATVATSAPTPPPAMREAMHVRPGRSRLPENRAAWLVMSRVRHETSARISS